MRASIECSLRPCRPRDTAYPGSALELASKAAGTASNSARAAVRPSAISRDDLGCGQVVRVLERVVSQLGILARLDLVLVPGDRRIRTRPAELRAYWARHRSVWIGAKRDLGPRDQPDLFLAHEDRLQGEVVKRGAGPWALAMGPSGVRPPPSAIEV